MAALADDGAVDMDMDMDTWLAATFEKLGLEGEVYAGYVEGIMADDSEPLEDRAASVMEILSGAAEGEVDPGLAGELVERWNQKAQVVDQEAAASAAAKEAAAAEQRKRDLELAAQEEEARQARALRNNELSREERQRREQLMST